MEDSADNTKYDGGATLDPHEESMRAMVNSNLDKHEWRTELERVGPRLKVTGAASGGWQERIEAMTFHTEKLTETKGGDGLKDMGAVSSNLKRELEQLGRGLTFLNRGGAVQTLCDAHADARVEAPNTQLLLDKITQLNSERSAVLAEVTEECGDVKEKLNSKGESMSDSRMVVEVKKQVKVISDENVELEVRLGVVMASLWGGHAVSKSASAQGKILSGLELESSIGSDEVLPDFDNDSITGGGDSIITGASSIASGSII